MEDTEISVGGAQDKLGNVGSLTEVSGTTGLPSDEFTAGGSFTLTLNSGASAVTAGDDIEIQLVHAPEGDASNVFFDETVEVIS